MNEPVLGEVASSMRPSMIRDVMDAAWRMGEAVRLEVGQPDFATPAHISDAAHAAALRGETGYAPNAGIGALREALAMKVGDRNGYIAEPEQIVVTPGGMGAISTTLRVLADPGDEVLLPDPGWPNFQMAAHLLGLRARSYGLHPENAHLPDVEELESLVGPRTKVLVVVSPSNPLGTVLSAEACRELVAFAERHDLWLLCDEVYDELTFDGAPLSVAAAAPSPRIVSIYSFSKVYAMCGWRVGYVVAPVAVARVLADVQEAISSSVNTPAQHGALAALTGPQDVVATMLDAYRRRRDLALACCAEQSIGALRPAGAFYVWADIAAGGLGSGAFVQRLLDDHRVAVAPGAAFGARGDGAVRISLASSEDDIREGIRRMGTLLRSLAGG